MDSYISINGKKFALTVEQLKELGVPVTNVLTPQAIQSAIRGENPHELLHIHDRVSVGDTIFEIVDMKPHRNVKGVVVPSVTFMSVGFVAKRRMHNGACKNGWVDCEMRAWMGKEYVKQIPEEWQKVISPAPLITNDGAGNAHVTTDLVWLPSESELFGSAIYASDEDGERFEAFSTSESRVRIDDEDEEAHSYWTRSAYGGSSSYFVTVNHYGYVYYYNASNTFYAPACFRIS